MNIAASAPNALPPTPPRKAPSAAKTQIQRISRRRSGARTSDRRMRSRLRGRTDVELIAEFSSCPLDDSGRQLHDALRPTHDLAGAPGRHVFYKMAHAPVGVEKDGVEAKAHEERYDPVAGVDDQRFALCQPFASHESDTPADGIGSPRASVGQGRLARDVRHAI